MAEFEVRAVEADEVRELRRALLRPHQKVEELVYAGDDHPDALHVGGFRHGQMVGIASITPRPMPGHPERAAWQVRGMAVDHGHRGYGLGGRLLRRLPGPRRRPRRAPGLVQCPSGLLRLLRALRVPPRRGALRAARHRAPLPHVPAPRGPRPEARPGASRPEQGGPTGPSGRGQARRHFGVVAAVSGPDSRISGPGGPGWSRHQPQGHPWGAATPVMAASARPPHGSCEYCQTLLDHLLSPLPEG